MADEYIKREDAVQLSKDIIRMVEDLRACDAIDYNAYSELFDMLCGFDTIPAADVRPVVLCKNCIHYETGVCLKIYDDGTAAKEAWQERKPDDFCSYGERRGNNED